MIVLVSVNLYEQNSAMKNCICMVSDDEAWYLAPRRREWFAN